MLVKLFTGSRGWKDDDSVIEAIATFQRPFIGLVGDADGFDAIVWEALGGFCLPRLRFDAKWKLYGRGAGHKRNDLMLDWLKAMRRRGHHCSVVAGWDGSSPGTKSMIAKAEDAEFPIFRLAWHPAFNREEEHAKARRATVSSRSRKALAQASTRTSARGAATRRRR